jgi:hypothetical protein
VSEPTQPVRRRMTAKRREVVQAEITKMAMAEERRQGSMSQLGDLISTGLLAEPNGLGLSAEEAQAIGERIAAHLDPLYVSQRDAGWLLASCVLASGNPEGVFIPRRVLVELGAADRLVQLKEPGGIRLMVRPA